MSGGFKLTFFFAQNPYFTNTVSGGSGFKACLWQGFWGLGAGRPLCWKGCNPHHHFNNSIHSKATVSCRRF